MYVRSPTVTAFKVVLGDATEAYETNAAVIVVFVFSTPVSAFRSRISPDVALGGIGFAFSQ